MVLHTIIGEYDVLYAQERELSGFFPDKPDKPPEIRSTDLSSHLTETSLSTLPTAENKNIFYRKGR